MKMSVNNKDNWLITQKTTGECFFFEQLAIASDCFYLSKLPFSQVISRKDK